MKFKNYLSRFLMLSSRMIQLNWDPFWRCTAFKYCLQKPWGHRCCSGSNDAIKPTQNRRNSGKKWWVLHSTGAIPPDLCIMRHHRRFNMLYYYFCCFFFRIEETYSLLCFQAHERCARRRRSIFAPYVIEH